jgi:cytochrome P450
MPPLHGERMQAYAQVMTEATQAAIARWPEGKPFALHPHMQAITLEVILRAVFGVDNPGLKALLVRLLEPRPAILVFVPALQRDFPLSPFRSFLRVRAEVVREIRAVIEARRRDPDAGARTDVLSLLLAARDDAGAPMTDAELVDELITMLVAGHETTATALSWAFALILDHPAVAARLVDELSGTDPAKHDYLDAVIKEALRLRPIIPDVVRETRAPYRLGDHELPVGVYVTPFIYGVHRRPDLYPEPERFRPERFLGTRNDPYSWFPFGGGIRRCLGMAFALYEMKIVLATVLASTQLRLAGPVRVVRRTLTFAPSGGTRVVLERRVLNRRLAAA